MDAAPDAIIVHRGGDVLYANFSRFEAIWCPDFEQLAAHNVLKLVPHDNIRTTIDRWKMVMNGQKVPLREARIFRLDGQEIPIEVGPSPIEYEGGRAIQAIIRDISDRKRAEKALHENETLLVANLDAMSRSHRVGTLFIQEGNLVSFLGEVVDTAIALSGSDFGNIQILDPKTLDLRIVAHRGQPEWWVDFWNVVSKGQGTCGTALARGERVIVEDVEQSPIFVGTPALDIQLKAGIRAVQSTPLVSRSGKPLGMFSTHYKKPHRPDARTLQLLDLLARQTADIIDRVQAEEWLRESERKYRELIQDANSIILSYDLNGKITHFNEYAQKFFGYDQDEILGKDVMCLVPEKESSGRSLETLISDVLERPDDFAENINENKLRNGDLVWISWRNRAIRDSSGNVTGNLAVGQDITERKHQEKRIAKVSRLYSILSHVNEAIVRTHDENVLCSEVCQIMAEEGISRLFG